MQNFENFTPPELYQMSVGVQKGSVSDQQYEQPTTDESYLCDSHSSSSCQPTLPPGEHFDILTPVPLFAGVSTDQSCLGTLVDIGIKRKQPDNDNESDTEDLNTTNRPGCYVDDYLLFEDDAEYDSFRSDDDEEDGFYSSTPKECYSPEGSSKLIEPVRKKQKHVSFVSDQISTNYSDLEIQTGSETDDNIGNGIDVVSISDGSCDSDALNATDTYINNFSTDPDNSECTDVDKARSIETENYVVTTKEYLSENDAFEELTTIDVYFVDGFLDPDSSDSSSDCSSDSDDIDEDIDCPDTCACKGGHSKRVEPIERMPGMKVSTPLYVKLLESRLMRKSNRMQYACCERDCNTRWPCRSKYQVIRDYVESDLRVDYFSWGTWKQEDLTCPSTCICKMGRSIEVQEIERRSGFRVVVPLYRKVLQLRLMRNSNRMKYDCCEKQCNMNSWRQVDRKRMVKDYWKSNLRVSRYSWGDWKDQPGQRRSGNGKKKRKLEENADRKARKRKREDDVGEKR